MLDDRDHCFVVSCVSAIEKDGASGEIVELAAKNDEDVDKWMKALQAEVEVSLV